MSLGEKLVALQNELGEKFEVSREEDSYRVTLSRGAIHSVQGEMGKLEPIKDAAAIRNLLLQMSFEHTYKTDLANFLDDETEVCFGGMTEEELWEKWGPMRAELTELGMCKTQGEN